MDGSVCLLDERTGHVLHTEKPHMKYVVSLAWAGDGRHFVSGSWDSSVAVHRTCAAVAADDGGAGNASVASSVPTASFETLKSLRFTAQVLSVVFLADGDTAVVAVRDSNYLRLVSIAALEVLS